MEFREFAEEVKMGIRSYLSESYKDAEISVVETKKLNHSYSALVIRNGDSVAAPSIDLEQFHNYYETFMSMDEVLTEISKMAQQQLEVKGIKRIEDYSMAKEQLFIRVSDAKVNKEVLKNVPHREENGLAITYHVAVELGEDGTASAMVTKELLKAFGVSEKQLHEDAVENSARLMPAQLVPMQSMMEKMLGIGGTEDIPMTFEQQVQVIDKNNPEPMMVLTNNRSAHGASVIFYPGVLESIGNQMGKDFFILPSSVHEVLILPDDGRVNRSELTMMVAEVNNSEVAAKDQLSYDVFHYDSTGHRLEKAVDFEKRMEERAPEQEKNESASKPKHRKEKSWER